jgi:hypothetical protein
MARRTGSPSGKSTAIEKIRDLPTFTVEDEARIVAALQRLAPLRKPECR